MTTKTFKQKAPTIQAIEVTNIFDQVADVANLIGASAYDVSVVDFNARFARDGAPLLAVREGQVVSLLDGAATVWDAKDFYTLYEAV